MILDLFCRFSVVRCASRLLLGGGVVLLLSCSASRPASSNQPSHTLKAPLVDPGVELVAPTAQDASKAASWLQYQSGLQAMENNDWLEAQYYLDLAMDELVSELADSLEHADGEYYSLMPMRIVQALEMVYPHLSELGSVDSNYAMASDMDFLDELDDVTLDSSERLEIKSFLDTLDLSRFSLPVELNDRVLKEIHFLTKSVRGFTEGSLSRKTAYEDMIKAKLRARGMPEDLIYLSLVESGFKIKAYSRAKASGLWQFIPATGRRYGLRNDFWVDMRRNPELATEAAIDYLSSLYKEFGDWKLAMAAYNCGEGRVRRLLREGTVDSIKPSYWDLKLPRETMHYVPRILAATIIGHFPEHYGFQVEPQTIIPFDTVTVEGVVPLENVAQAVSVGVNTIRDLNLELERWCTPPNQKQYVLRVPQGTREQFLEAYAKMDRSQFSGWQQYRVRSGDFLGRIANNFGLSVYDLRQANNLKSDRLRIGQMLVIPMPVGAMASKRSQEAPVSSKRGKSYIVRRGDNLGAIARRYGVSIQDIKDWNQLPDSRLRVGQRLRLQSGAQNSESSVSVSKSTVKSSGKKYTVQSGDSYYSIASSLGVDMADLMALNGADNSRLYLGQELLVPAGAVAPSPKKSAPATSLVASTYTVKSGDNLYSISRRLGVDLSDLQRWNNLSGKTDIRPGQKLQVKGGSASPKAETVSSHGASFYVVRTGDNLWDIARRHGISVQQITEWNALDHIKLQPGMRLRVSP